MKNWPKNLLRSQKLALTVVALYVIMALAMMLAIFDQVFGFGDQSLFYSFARNLAQGEAIYSDFIHFRTPGSYFLQGLFVWLFGDSIAVLNMAMKFESIVLYGLVFLISVCLIFWKNPKLLVSTSILSAIALLFYPAVLQLRSGFALLAVAFYIVSFKTNSKKAKKLTYGLAGLLTGLSFIFGQDMAVLPVVVIGTFELVMAINVSNFREFLKRAAWLFGGFGLGVLPLLIYVITVSDINNFLYYTLYYAFFLQPKGMDTAYPSLGFANIEYYLPIVIYVTFLFLVYATKDRFLRTAGGVILAFASVHMISMFGRSDLLHLLFSISQLLIIIPFSIYLVYRQREFSIKQVFCFLPWLAAYGIVVIIAIKKKGAFVVIMPLIISLMITYGDRLNTIIIRWLNRIIAKNPLDKFIPGLVLGVLLASIFLICHKLVNTVIVERVEVIMGSLNYSNKGVVGGIYTSKDNQFIVDEVQKFISDKKPNSIFSYPIQPYFYSMTKNHATRFMSFEPQTTGLEQDQTIDDLKKSRPEVVVFDPLQAEAMSKSLWKINQYIMNNYKTVQVLNHKIQLWLMVPRQKPVNREYPAFSINHHTQSSMVTVLQNPKYNIKNALLVYDKFSYPLSSNSKEISLQIVTRPELNSQFKPCSKLVIIYGNHTTKTQNVCEADGRTTIKLDSQKSPVSVEFYGNNQQPVVWNNVFIAN